MNITKAYHNILQETELPRELTELIEEYDIPQCSRLTMGGTLCPFKAEFEENETTEDCRHYCQIHCMDSFKKLIDSTPSGAIFVKEDNPNFGIILNMEDELPQILINDIVIDYNPKYETVICKLLKQNPSS